MRLRNSNSAAVARVLLAFALILPVVAPSSVEATSAALALRVEGARLVDAAGRQVVLRGVSRSGTEFACVNEGGFGFSLGPLELGSIDGIKSWGANVVRVPLNEHCWLGINGVNPLYSGAAYRAAIKSFVDLLTANGMYTLLDLHWSGPGAVLATHQAVMADAEHAVDFWSSVASTFKGNDAVIFELFNEPLPDDQRDSVAAWTCWRDGGTCAGADFPVAGMQSLVDAVRATGATNVLALGGVGFANYLSRWLEYRPRDPLNNLVAVWHVYNFSVCNSAVCWSGHPASVMAQVPVVVTETGMNSCDGTWWNGFLDWLDARRVGYLAWTWNRWSTDCSSRALVTDYYAATPTAYGEIFRAHLAALPADTTTTLTSSAAASAEGQTVTFATTVSAPAGRTVPSGSVTLSLDGVDVATSTLDASGIAAFSVTFADDGAHSIIARYQAASGFAPSTSVTLTHQVTNVAPRVGVLTGPSAPAAVGATITVTAQFSDSGTGDTHRADVDWGDGTTGSATVAESAGSGTLSAQHAYASAGVYRATATVTDDDGGAGASSIEALVVFDASAGSARGAGWFSSPAGALKDDPLFTGRAHFGFLARYKQDGTVPFSQPGFRLRTDRFTFDSTGYDWLVVTEPRARLQGQGRVNGRGSYAFLLTAIDGDALGTSDLLRIKIWDVTTGAVFYDTQPGDADGAEPARTIGAGSIAIGTAP